MQQYWYIGKTRPKILACSVQHSIFFAKGQRFLPWIFPSRPPQSCPVHFVFFSHGCFGPMALTTGCRYGYFRSVLPFFAIFLCLFCTFFFHFFRVRLAHCFIISSPMFGYWFSSHAFCFFACVFVCARARFILLVGRAIKFAERFGYKTQVQDPNLNPAGALLLNLLQRQEFHTPWRRGIFRTRGKSRVVMSWRRRRSGGEMKEEALAADLSGLCLTLCVRRLFWRTLIRYYQVVVCVFFIRSSLVSCFFLWFCISFRISF